MKRTGEWIRVSGLPWIDTNVDRYPHTPEPYKRGMLKREQQVHNASKTIRQRGTGKSIRKSRDAQNRLAKGRQIPGRPPSVIGTPVRREAWTLLFLVGGLLDVHVLSIPCRHRSQGSLFLPVFLYQSTF